MQGIFGTSRRTRPQSTVRAEWLMEESQRLAMGKRIAQLRERGPFTQPEIADKLGIGLRGYQKYEVRGTSKHERCEELVEIHAWTREAEGWEHVSADWIWDGRMPKGATPDLFPAEPYAERLDDIDRKLTELLRRLNAVATLAQTDDPLHSFGALLTELEDQQTGPAQDEPESRQGGH